MKSMYQDICTMVREVRYKLEKEYGNQKDFNFSGLCDTASNMLYDKLDGYCGKLWKVESVKLIHGELAHKRMFKSEDWWRQHTMVLATVYEGRKKRHIYIDATSQQFKFLNKSIPDWVVQDKCPNWFYPDSRNPRWFTKSHRIQDIIAVLQFSIHGTISDWLRKK